MKRLRFLGLVMLFLCWSSYAQADIHTPEPLNLDSAALSQLYNPVSGYIWLKNGQYTAQAHDAIEFIASAASHGFNPLRYHYDLLTYLDPESSKIQAQQFDLLLSDALLKLTHDMAIGQYVPAELDPDWKIPRITFDAVSYLQQALINKQLKHQLNQLVPDFIEYQILGTALSRYQTYIERGGWQAIPDTPLLNPGDVHPSVPIIHARLKVINSALLHPKNSNFYDPNLVVAVKHFQQRHGLKVDGIFGSETRLAMNVSAQQRLQQIKLNLERIRWLPRDLGSRYLLVNVPNYNLTAIEDGITQLNMRVIVGRKSRPTSSFSTQISHLVLNPYWNVPRRLARLDLLPKQQQNPNYFYLQNIRVYERGQGIKSEIDPYNVDWHEFSSRNFPYTLRQDPGEKNALGTVKFFMPNSWDIYLHDTPNKSLFLDSKRNFSSGCIRVENPTALAEFSLNNSVQQSSILESIATGENQWHKLENPLNIYITYFTAWADDKGLIFAPDSYQRDQQLAKQL